MSAVPVLPHLRRCCRCNGTAKCLRCACVRNGTPCSYCLPGEAGNCHNTLSSGQLSSVTRPPSASSVQSSASSAQASQPFVPSSASSAQASQSLVPPPAPRPPPPAPATQARQLSRVSPPPSSPPEAGLPSLSTILQSSIPTLQHVPKGARNRWARVLAESLSSVTEDPGDGPRKPACRAPLALA